MTWGGKQTYSECSPSGERRSEPCTEGPGRGAPALRLTPAAPHTPLKTVCVVLYQQGWWKSSDTTWDFEWELPLFLHLMFSCLSFCCVTNHPKTLFVSSLQTATFPLAPAAVDCAWLLVQAGSAHRCKAHSCICQQLGEGCWLGDPRWPQSHDWPLAGCWPGDGATGPHGSQHAAASLWLLLMVVTAKSEARVLLQSLPEHVSHCPFGQSKSQGHNQSHYGRTPPSTHMLGPRCLYSRLHPPQWLGFLLLLFS